MASPARASDYNPAPIILRIHDHSAAGDETADAAPEPAPGGRSIAMTVLLLAATVVAVVLAVAFWRGSLFGAAAAPSQDPEAPTATTEAAATTAQIIAEPVSLRQHSPEATGCPASETAACAARESGSPSATGSTASSAPVTSKSAKPMAFLANLGLNFGKNNETANAAPATSASENVPPQPATFANPNESGPARPVITGVRSVAPPANFRPYDGVPPTADMPYGASPAGPVPPAPHAAWQPSVTPTAMQAGAAPQPLAGGLTGEVIPAHHPGGSRLIVGQNGGTILLPAEVPAIPVPPQDALNTTAAPR